MYIFLKILKNIPDAQNGSAVHLQSKNVMPSIVYEQVKMIRIARVVFDFVHFAEP